MAAKPYGSGYFGEWVEDEFGLPAYRYTCDQVKDPKAITPVNPIWRSPTEHSHQIGNNRFVAVASNYGYVQVRQDEGSPKYLNDYAPQNSKYAGGFGYLTDGQTMLSTFYSGQNKSFNRIFGVGYLRKTVTAGSYLVDQVIFAPYGDDPLLISQVTVVNRRDVPVDLRWVEYWECQMYQFWTQPMLIALILGNTGLATELRREFAEQFTHSFRVIGDGTGLVEEKHFKGWDMAYRPKWAAALKSLTTKSMEWAGAPVEGPVKEASQVDLAPPPTFLVSLDAHADGMTTNSRQFFGGGGVEHPDGLNRPLPGDLSATGSESALLLERRFHLRPGARRILTFAYGYLPEGCLLETLLSRYHDDLPNLWARSSEAWKKTGRIQLNIPDESWVDRELTWHNYYLRSNLTYDSYFQEHVLSQGHVYQYIFGFQGAARDPLQHALPFVFSQPEIVKQIIRYTVEEISPDGEIPYGIVGHGMIMPVPFRPSDQEMWLLWLASEYVLATRDKTFLDEMVPTYPVYGPEAGKEKIGNLLSRCYHHLVEVTGTGEHGLLRISNGDWNDGAVIGYVPREKEGDVRKYGESVLNAAMASYVLDLYARMLTYVGQTKLASEARRKAEEQRRAVHAQWVEGWFRRSWLTRELGWVGEDELWLEPQPWAIIGGAATAEQIATLIESINELVRKPSPIGAMLMSKCIKRIASPIGEGVNAGIWLSINGTLVWALALINGSMAWDEWKKNTLAQHAEAYPEIWYGIWSGPDTYNSVLSRRPGHTIFDERPSTGDRQNRLGIRQVNWTDFPVMNMHPHAWTLYDVAKLMGVEFTPEGLELTPCLPKNEYHFVSPVVGLDKSKEEYSGWYAPSVTGKWQVTLRIPENERSLFKNLEVNGKKKPLTRTADGAFKFAGDSLPGKPLHWVLT